MKKISALILITALLLSLLALSSCNNGGNEGEGAGEGNTPPNSNVTDTLAGQTPEQLYQSVKDKLADAKSYVVDSTQVIVMTQGEENMTMNQTVINKVDGDNNYIKMYNDMTTAANMEIWYVDGIIYTSTASGKIKAPVDKEDFMQNYMDKDPSESTLLDIPESWFEGISFEKETDEWVLKLTISEEKYEMYFSNIGLGADIIGDVQYNVYFDEEGNLQKITTVVDYTVEGIHCHCDTLSLVSYENIEITAPADADSYADGYLQ